MDVITVSLDDDHVIIWRIAGLNIRSGTYHWHGTQTFVDNMTIIGWARPYSFRSSGYLLTAP